MAQEIDPFTLPDHPKHTDFYRPDVVFLTVCTWS